MYKRVKYVLLSREKAGISAVNSAYPISYTRISGVDMSLPSKSDPRWRDIVNGKKDPPFTCLATKLMITRLRLSVQKDPGTIGAAIDEMYNYFVSSPFAAKDAVFL